jgi:hypothetical protein
MRSSRAIERQSRGDFTLQSASGGAPRTSAAAAWRRRLVRLFSGKFSKKSVRAGGSTTGGAAGNASYAAE